MQGVVTQIIHNRGFGFIRGDDGLSRFFHASFVIPEVDFDLLSERDKVDFEPDNDGPEGKLRAKQVRRRK